MTKDIAPVDLSPQFLAANDIVGVQQDERALVVTALRPLSDRTLAALQFAAGRPVVGVIAERQPTDVRTEFATADRGGPAVSDGSLTTSLLARLNRNDRLINSLVSFADCLGSGYSPREAADLMLSSGAGALADTDLRQFYHDLSAQGDLAVAVARCKAVPYWLSQAVAASADPETHSDLVAQIVPVTAAVRAESRQDRFRKIFFAAIWMIAASAWALLSILAGLIVAAAGLAFVLWQRGDRDAGPLQSGIMRVVHAAHQANLPPAVSIRTAGHFLMQSQVLQGQTPDTRESLGAALHLSPLRQAIFAKGDLGEAADRLAILADRDGILVRSRARRIVGSVGISAFVPLFLNVALQ